MTPCHYADIWVTDKQAKPLAAALIVKKLHESFSLVPSSYALALPDYGNRVFRRLRVFASSRDELDQLVATINDDEAFNNYGRFGYPQVIPEDFAGPWACYTRYRIPTRKQERKEDGTVRIRRMQYAECKQIPFFAIASKSTKQAFRLHVQMLPGAPNQGECHPDSYGLSVTSRQFSVPVL